MEKLIRKLAEKYSLSYEKVKKILDFASFSVKPQSKILEVKEVEETTEFVVKRTGLGPISTTNGIFYLFMFTLDDIWGEYFALVKVDKLNEKGIPEFIDKETLILRIDSGCETGQRFHDNTCECSEQLYEAMSLVEKKGEGIIINIPSQDGRGKGLPFKLGTLGLQLGFEMDTIEAATVMLQIHKGEDISKGNPLDEIDSRTYAGCIAILKFFEVPVSTKINIATNNPKKIKVFKDNGYTTESIPVIIKPTEQTKKHLLAKQNLLGHMLFI